MRAEPPRDCRAADQTQKIATIRASKADATAS
jgi:hypothetical protein